MLRRILYVIKLQNTVTFHNVRSALLNPLLLPLRQSDNVLILKKTMRLHVHEYQSYSNFILFLRFTRTECWFPREILFFILLYPPCKIVMNEMLIDMNFKGIIDICSWRRVGDLGILGGLLRHVRWRVPVAEQDVHQPHPSIWRQRLCGQ